MGTLKQLTPAEEASALAAAHVRWSPQEWALFVVTERVKARARIAALEAAAEMVERVLRFAAEEHETLSPYALGGWASLLARALRGKESR